MKIAYYSYPWAMDVMGGGERQLLTYRDHLRREGLNIRLFDQWNPQFDDLDIFHVFSVMPGSLEICDYAKRRGAKLVVSPNIWIEEATKQNYPCDLIWNYFELADAIVVNSVMEMQALSRIFGVAEAKFRVVYNAAEIDFVLPGNPDFFRKHSGIAGPYVLNVANVEPRKNQLRFMQALRRVRPDLSLVVVGSVRDSAYAEACHKAGEGHFRVVGTLPYASALMRSALAGCAFFAMPSLLETPSIAAIEAAASGARVLVTAVGSTQEYFAQTVTYVQPDSDESLATGIEMVLKAEVADSQWRSRSGFLWPIVLPSLMQTYSALHGAGKEME